MLVLSRKEGQLLYIGDNIIIKVVELANGKVRLGIRAPSSVKVVRDELVSDDERRDIYEQSGKP